MSSIIDFYFEEHCGVSLLLLHVECTVSQSECMPNQNTADCCGAVMILVSNEQGSSSFVAVYLQHLSFFITVNNLKIIFL